MLTEVRGLSESGNAVAAEPTGDPAEEAEDITPLDIAQTLVEDIET